MKLKSTKSYTWTEPTESCTKTKQNQQKAKKKKKKINRNSWISKHLNLLLPSLQILIEFNFQRARRLLFVKSGHKKKNFICSCSLLKVQQFPLPNTYLYVRKTGARQLHTTHVGSRPNTAAVLFQTEGEKHCWSEDFDYPLKSSETELHKPPSLKKTLAVLLLESSSLSLAFLRPKQ